MTQYLCLIYANEKDTAARDEGWQKENMQAYMKFTGELQEAGAMVSGDPLEATSTATTVRVREGKTLTTDGPFAETKEQLGGYYLIEAKDLDEATAWAAKIPASWHGSVEVRPVMQMPGG